MKQGIHPNWTHNCTVTCSCGNKFVTGASVDHLEVDICSACHPFFTGEMKFVDRQGRVEKFMKKRAAAAKVADAQSKKAAKAKKDQGPTKSYKQILKEQQTAIKNMKQAAQTAANNSKQTEAKTSDN